MAEKSWVCPDFVIPFLLAENNPKNRKTMENIPSRILSAIFRHLKSRPTFESVGISEYRTLLDQSARAFRPDPKTVFTPFALAHMNAAWLIPEDPAPGKVILYVHGGGYIAGSIRSHRDLASRIARAAGMRTLLFEYRLAPEHPFPAGADDVALAWEFLNSQTTSSGLSPAVSVVGDSAGGGLCLGLLARLDRENAPFPACAALMSPWADLTCTLDSHRVNREKDPMLSRSVLKKAARLYTDRPLDDLQVSPLRYPFRKMCPLLIHAGTDEVLLDDSKTLARMVSSRLGTPVELEIYNQMFHVWHYFARYLPEGRRAVDRIGRFLRSHT